jgi:ComF family protein
MGNDLQILTQIANLNSSRNAVKRTCMQKKARSSFNFGHNLWQRSFDLLLPARCVLCGQASPTVCICSGCRQDLPSIGAHCQQCCLPLAIETDSHCGQCLHKPPPFTVTVSPLRYEFPVDSLVQALKFKRQLAEGRVLSHLMCQQICRQGVDLPQVLIPVPLHRMRMIKRGFNQAYELAGYIGRTLGIPLHIAGLRRGRNTEAQSGLNRAQRRRNLRDAFYWRGTRSPAPHIALVDDVMTTGATVAECSKVLKKAGAKRVDIWVAARAVPAGRKY